MMCDTSLAPPANRPATGARSAASDAQNRERTSLTCANAETAKVIGKRLSVKGTYPQFGPVVDLAYTRWRATW
jgi:hypothetical protein